MEREKLYALIREAKNGSNEAFEHILRIFQPMIYKCVGDCIRYTRDDYDDLRQLASIALWDAVKTFNEKNPSFYRYAKTLIMRSLMVHTRDEFIKINHTRNALSWESDQFDDTIPDVSKDVYRILDSKEELRSVFDVVSKDLRVRDKEVFFMYFIRDMRIQDIADYYGINYGAAYQRIYRMISRLRSIYEEVDSR